MFTRSLLKKIPARKSIHPVIRHYASSSSKEPNQWLGPKFKRLLLYTGGAATLGGAAVYLSQDHSRVVDMYGAHEHVPYLAIHPKKGGVKDLPITEYYLDDDERQKMDDKPRLVIIGSGWGAISVLKNLDKEKYNVTIVSENNYFLFTPLLPSATVGTLELR